MDENLTCTRFSNPIRVDNLNEILKLKLNNEDRFLIKNQEPLAAIWRGNNESSSFFAWISCTSSDIVESVELDEMNQLLQDKIGQDIALEDVLGPLLGIVESGLYQLFYHDPFPVRKGEIVQTKSDSFTYPQNYSLWSRPFHNDKKSDVWIDGTILYTQDLDALDEKRVEYYKKSILAGKRPTIVTMSLAELEFYTTKEYLKKKGAETAQLTLEYGAECIYPQLIIDGHHKAKAYEELNKKPSILNLTKLHLKEESENNDWDYKSVEETIESRIGEMLYVKS